MRLTPEQIALILRVVADQTGPGARVALFGSRVDDSRRGGDVDLLIENDPPLSGMQCAGIRLRLEAELFLPVDILVVRRKPTAFQGIAQATAIPLGVTT